MGSWETLEQVLREKLSGERLAHSYRVVEAARELAVRFGVPVAAVETAALMHDYAKVMPATLLLEEGRRRNLIIDPAEEISPGLLHGAVAAALLAERGVVTEQTALDAIRWHTTGRANMSPIEQVVWLADYIEPGRRFPGVDHVRDVARLDLTKALLMALNMTICFIVDRDRRLHLQSVHARNWLLSSVRLDGSSFEE